MNLLFDSFWRAVAYSLRPRVIVLSMAPLLLMVLLSLGFAHFYWDSTLIWLRGLLDASTLIDSITGWMQSFGLGGFKSFLGPLLVIFAVLPVIVVTSLLLVALLMTPTLTALVADRRFPTLEKKNGGSLALLALLVSLPLWLVPPLILVLPPLIWGWLTYRVMAFDALAAHASVDERREIFRRHHMALLGIGVFCGFLGAAPSLIWASGVLFAATFLILVPIGIWLYTLVFALSSLWFSHYCLAALLALRLERAAPVATSRRVTDLSLIEAETFPLG
jgi:hypothetical protein